MSQFGGGTAALWPWMLKLRRDLLSTFIRVSSLRMDDRQQTGALLIAASLVAAIRLRGEPIKPSPKLRATIYDSVQLVRMIMARLQRQ